METRSPSAVRSHAIPAILFCILAGGFPSVAQVPRRSEEPVVLTGSALPQLSGAVPSRIVAFRSASPWTQVPVQIDERALVTFATIYNSTQPARSSVSWRSPVNLVSIFRV